MSSFFASLRHRRPQLELMDAPDLDAGLHTAALRALARINRVTRANMVFWPAIRDLANQQNPLPVRVLDIASGGGDVARALARKAQRHGLALQVAACDKSAIAIRHARHCDALGPARRVNYFQLDALRDPLPNDYDILTSSLFLHHLSTHDAVLLLRKMAAASRQLVLVSDLLRTRPGYALAWVGPPILTRSPVVRTDAILSVAAAFSRTEVRQLARDSGLEEAHVTRHWPQRFVLQWRRVPTSPGVNPPCQVMSNPADRCPDTRRQSVARIENKGLIG